MLVDGRYLVTSPSTARCRTGAPATARCDAATHTYYLTYTPRETGPLTLGVADLDLADNLGTVHRHHRGRSA